MSWSFVVYDSASSVVAVVAMVLWCCVVFCCFYAGICIGMDSSVAVNDVSIAVGPVGAVGRAAAVVGAVATRLYNSSFVVPLDVRAFGL